MFKINHLNLKSLLTFYMLVALCMAYAGAGTGENILTPDDPVIGQPDDGDWPDNEAPQYAIDGDVETKYLHFRSADPQPIAGIIVSPQFGTGTPQSTVVQEIGLWTANDAPERDPVSYELFGSNGTVDGPWELISNGDIIDFDGPEWPRHTRNETAITFANVTEYIHYKLMFPNLRGDGLFQIAEIELIGFPGEGVFYIDQHPENVLVSDGDDAIFKVTVISDIDVEYQWYVDDSPIMGATAAELIIPAAALEDEGLYHCLVTDAAGSTERVSGSASLAIARLRAHWTLDQNDFGGGQYLDVSTEDPFSYNASVNGNPIFVDGIVGDAVQMVDSVGAANAGRWNPMEHSNQMTVSLWVNWAGSSDAWQKLAAQRGSGDYLDETSHWQISVAENTSNLIMQSTHSWVQVDGGVIDDDQWQHIAVTYADGTAKIYVDGELATEGAFAPSSDPEAPLMIGCQDPEWYAPASGSMDDVRIYNYALDDMEIAEVYYTGSGNMPCLNPPALDFTGDCQVGLADFSQLAVYWLYDGLYSP